MKVKVEKLPLEELLKCINKKRNELGELVKTKGVDSNETI